MSLLIAQANNFGHWMLPDLPDSEQPQSFPQSPQDDNSWTQVVEQYSIPSVAYSATPLTPPNVDSQARSETPDWKYTRRKEQNRQAQRTYRDKKTNAIRLLEQEKAELRQKLSELEVENKKLRQHLLQYAANNDNNGNAHSMNRTHKIVLTLDVNGLIHPQATTQLEYDGQQFNSRSIGQKA